MSDITHKLKQMILLSFLMVFVSGFAGLSTTLVSAQPATSSNTGSSSKSSSGQPCATSGTCADCTQGGNGCVSCNNGTCADPAAKPNAACNNHSCDFVTKYINPAINLLSVCFGVLAVGSLIMGGIQYTTSEGDPQKTSAAKNRVSNTILAVVAYLFLYSFLQFIVPGGIF